MTALAASTDKLPAWHFLPSDRRLQFEPHTLIEPGATLRHEGKLRLCHSGLHASIRALDALAYASGPIVCRVACGGEVIYSDDKLVCRERTCLWLDDATDVLHVFAREAALSVAHFWDCPPVVRTFLETGDEQLRAATRAAASAATEDAAWAAASAAARAARNAAMDAAWAAARAAAKAARNAAMDAAKDAAWAAAWAVAGDAARDVAMAAWAAAWTAARDAARSELNDMLESMLLGAAEAQGLLTAEVSP